MASEFSAVLFLVSKVEGHAQKRPSARDCPFLRRQRTTGTRNQVHRHHSAGHENCTCSNRLIVLNLIRTRHIRLFLSQNQKRNRYHAVGQTAGQISGIADPDQHSPSGERSQHRNYAYHDQRVNRSLILRMQFCEEIRDHLGICHRIHRTASSHQERVPAGDNSAETSDDDNIRHGFESKSLYHCICSNQTVSGHRAVDFSMVHQASDSNNNQRIEYNGQDDRQNQDFPDLFQRSLYLLRSLRNNIKTDEKERRHYRYMHHMTETAGASGSRKQLRHQIGCFTSDRRDNNQQHADTENNSRKQGLKVCCRLGSPDIDQRHNQSNSRSQKKPAGVDLESAYSI